MAFLEIRAVSKSFNVKGKPRSASALPVLRDINLVIAEREFVCIVGRSGAGKTTLISLIAGLLQPDRGEILLQGKAVQGPGPERGIVFQNYSLLPWMTVYENVHLAVDAIAPNLLEKAKRERTEKYIELVNLTNAVGKRPRELSGGMRQRVAVARGLAMDPKVLLMDEPFSALDELTRGQLQDDLLQLWNLERKTVLFVTHNISEAVYLADRVVVMSPHPGRIKTILSIDLPRPRSVEMHETPEFMRWIRTAREALRS
jgi:nitrate/nitrite transport system ATP-binding protein